MRLFKVHPEIIGIHVPKTAGTAFQHILHDHYGKRLQTVYKPEDIRLWNGEKTFRSNRPGVKAIYGHIQATPACKQQFPDAKLITWLRDPAERVISLYYYFKDNRELYRGRPFEAFLDSEPSLTDFVTAEECWAIVNAYTSYLGRINPSDIDFVGRTEFFDEDLDKLGLLLDIKFKREKQPRNVNTKKPEIAKELKEQMKSLLKDEYDLYHKLLKRGGNRNANG